MTVSIDELGRRQPQLEQERDAVFERTFQDHWARVTGVVFRLVGDRAEAEDIALDTFWRLYQRKARQPTNVSAWLYRVATNRGLNALRARARREAYEGRAGRAALERETAPNPEAEAIRAAVRRDVRGTLAHMRQRSARLLVLRHSGCSYADIAAALNISAGSVGTLLARAEREFERQYGKPPPGEEKEQDHALE
ncbi:MAG: sigma-70 family RNA polymerase sigma factor [Anaerolineales bacterium]